MRERSSRELWQEVAKRKMPSQIEIFEETKGRLGLEGVTRIGVLERFEDYLKDMVRGTGFEVYIIYEETTLREFLKEVAVLRHDILLREAEELLGEIVRVGGQAPPEKVVDFATAVAAQLMVEHIPYLGKAISNTRRARAGSQFQLALEYLLREKCQVSCQRGYLVGRTDIVIPQVEVFRRRPERSVLLELKTTLRERWKTAKLEQIRLSHAVWIVTLDEGPGSETLQEIQDMRLSIYLPKEPYRRYCERFEAVRPLSRLPEDIRPYGG
jgi:hypothetical protein